MRKLVFLFLSAALLFSADSYYYNNNKKVQLTPLPKSSLQSKSLKEGVKREFYTIPNGSVVGVSDEILIQTEHIEYILSCYSVELLAKLGDTLYLLRAKEATQTLQLANKLYEDEKVLLAHPNFTKEIQKR